MPPNPAHRPRPEGEFGRTVAARIATSALVALVLVPAGCGDSQQPDDVVRDHFAAIAGHDGKRACDQLSAPLRADIERAPAARGAGRSCADIMKLAAGLNPSVTQRNVKDLKISVQRDGDRARATLKNPLSRRDETLRLVKDGARWRISRLQTRPRP